MLFNKGRRIVDMSHVFNQIQNSGNHVSGLGCNFMNVEFLNENTRGFTSSWTFICKMCNSKTIITSEDQNNLDIIPLNKAAVNATVAAGIGFTQLAELTAAMDILCMSPSTYSKYNDLLSKDVNETAWEAMRLAGIEEKRLALELDDLDEDGTPMCPVIADGQWSKRSYKTKYDALSGAVIKKLFFVDLPSVINVCFL